MAHADPLFPTPPDAASPAASNPPKRSKRGPPWLSITVAGMMALLALVLGWYSWFCPAAREARDFMSHMPEDQIIEVQLQLTWPDHIKNRPLIHITDRKQIAAIAAAIRTATEGGVTHHKWIASVCFVTKEHNYYGQACQNA